MALPVNVSVVFCPLQIEVFAALMFIAGRALTVTVVVLIVVVLHPVRFPLTV